MAEQNGSSLTTPQMTYMAGRPIKVLYVPSSDILVACRTANGEDVHVPLTALFAAFEAQIVSGVAAKIREEANRQCT